jgi:hypothetical protein
VIVLPTNVTSPTLGNRFESSRAHHALRYEDRVAPHDGLPLILQKASTL